MAISYLDIRALIDDASFQKRLQVAVWREASALLRKSPAQADALLAWARDQLHGPTRNLVEVTIRVATGGATNDAESVYNKGAAVTDADLQRIVGVVAPDLAGV